MIKTKSRSSVLSANIKHDCGKMENIKQGSELTQKFPSGASPVTILGMYR
jgi:hypothetical protein